MNKRLWLLLLCLAFLAPMSAQQEVMRLINEIKARAHEDHLLTEQMMVDKADDNASRLCAAGLLRQLGGGYTMDDIKPYLHQIVMNRGEKKLVFLYLDKDSLGTPSSTPPKRDTTPVKVELRQDLPEKPALPTVSNPTPTVPAQTTTPSRPVVADKPVTPANSKSDSKSTNAMSRLVSQQQPFFMQEVMSHSSASAVSRSLSLMKEQGLISDYGIITAEKNTADSYLILFNGKPPYAPITILSPSDEGQRLNLRTREVDSLSNHPGCEAIWLTVK